jgi:pyruvate kinase
MLSEESAMGDYPLEAVQMLAKIAAAIEPRRLHRHSEFVLKLQVKDYIPTLVDLIAVGIENILTKVESPYVTDCNIKGNCVIKTEGPSGDHPEVNHGLEIIQW